MLPSLIKSIQKVKKFVISLLAISIIFPAFGFSEIEEYDFTKPIKDGVILVGIECNHNTKSLEIGIFEGGYPPQKRMDLWKTTDLISYDAKTNMISVVKSIERKCNIGVDHYRIRLSGLPGSAYAMSPCGGIVTATAKVWKNGNLLLEQQLMRCGADEPVRLIRLVSGSDSPEIIREDN